MQTEQVASSQSFLPKCFEHFFRPTNSDKSCLRNGNGYGVALNWREEVLRLPLVPFAILGLKLKQINIQDATDPCERDRIRLLSG